MSKNELENYDRLVYSSSASISDSTLTNNRAAEYGGAIIVFTQAVCSFPTAN